MSEKVLLVADMEGCCGIYDLKDRRDSSKKMIDEVDFVITTLRKFGVTEITVLDCHNDGTTLRGYCNEHNIPHLSHLWSLPDTAEYSCAYLVGFHGQTDTLCHFPHSIRQEICSIYLGQKDIGEVSLVINYLAFFHIPVVYISGDDVITNELTDYCGVFLATKCKNDSESNLNDHKKRIEIALESSLRVRRDLCYSSQEITIELKSPTFYSFIPSEEFCCQNNKISFRNTVSFVHKMKLFCSYLNIAAQYHRLRLGQISEKLKTINLQLICLDEQAKKMLLKDDIHSFADEDFVYLTKLINSLQGEIQ